MELYDKKYVYFDWDDELEGKKGFFADSINDLKRNVNNNISWFGEIHKCTNSHSSFPFEFINDSDIFYPFKFCYYDPNLKVKKAWIEGKKIQYYSSFDKWQDLNLVETCNIEDYLHNEDWDEYEWRVKPEYVFDDIVDYSNYQPTEPKYYLSVNKNDSYLEFTISQNITNDTIYNGTRKECERMIKIIGNEIDEEDLSHWYISNRLRYIIDKYSHEKYKRRMTNRELSEYLAKGNGEMKKLGYFINTSIYHCYKNNTENENVNDNILIRDFGSDEWRSPLIEV